LPNEPRWLRADEIIEINKIEMTKSGEPFHILNPDGLEGAAARPRNIFLYGAFDTVELATELLIGLAVSHPFVQGNKRTALISCVTFLNLNGYAVRISDNKDFANAIIAVITREISRDDFVFYMKGFCDPTWMP